MQRKRRSERREETRANLFLSARDLFARRGYNATSVDDIAENAGYTKGAFYANFETKDAVAMAILEENVTDDDAHLHAEFDAAFAETGQLIPTIIRCAEQASSDNRRDLLSVELLLQMSRMERFGAAGRALFARRHAAMCRFVNHILHRLDSKPIIDPALLASIILGLQHGHVLLRVAGDQTRYADVIANVLGRLINASPTEAAD